MNVKKMKTKSSRLRKPLVLLLGILVTGGILLYAGWIKVLYPNGGEVLKTGTAIQVKWQSQDINGQVVIVLYKKGIKYMVISEQTENNGTFPWNIPANLPEGSDYRVRIRGVQDLAVNDFSDRDFTIKK